MQQIPQPELLDADRITSADRDDMTMFEHRNRAQQLDDALHASCAYATELWQHLAAARSYLYHSLPSDPRSPGTNPHPGASPTGPDDREGWQRWIDTYATVTSILVGPHGDSGFGLEEAQRAARDRRDAPNLNVLARVQRGTGTAASADPLAVITRSDGNDSSTSAVSSIGARSFRLAALGALGVLALRGLRPRRRLQ